MQVKITIDLRNAYKDFIKRSLSEDKQISESRALRKLYYTVDEKFTFVQTLDVVIHV